MQKIIIFISIFYSSILFAFPPKSTTYVYFSVHNENKIKIYKLNPVTEQLVYVDEINTNGSPYPLVVNHNNSVLYSGNWLGNFRTGKGKIQSFKINANTGILSNLNTVDGIDIPVCLSLSKNEKYLLSCSFGRNSIATQSIDSLGKVASKFIEKITLPAAKNRNWPHMIKTNLSGNIVYATSMGSNEINQFSFNENTGSLKALSPSKIIVSPTYSGPRHFVYHPTLDIVYFSNELNNKIMVTNHSANGLNTSAIQEINIFPSKTLDNAKKTSDINITPNGKYVYCTVRRPNNSNGTIVAYSVDPATGKLTMIASYDTEKVVRDFDIDPSGQFLIVAGENSGNSVLYKIENNGTLNKKQHFNVGTKPYWVLAVTVY